MTRASDLILYNGKIFIAPGRYAQAVAVEGGRITEILKARVDAAIFDGRIVYARVDGRGF